MSMLKTTMQDAAGPLARFSDRMGGAYSFQNLAIRYGETSVSVRFPPVRPQNFRELLAAEFVADGWTYNVIFDSRGVRSGSAVGLKFHHPITVSRDGTQAQGRPKSITVTVQLPDPTVPLTPDVHERLVSEAASVASTLVYNQYLREEYAATERRSRIEKRHRHGLGLTDPTAFPGSAYSVPVESLKKLGQELWEQDASAPEMADLADAPEVECP